MACCNNNACAVCNGGTRQRYQESSDYWARIDAGKGLSRSERLLYNERKYNKKIYSKMRALQKKMDQLRKELK
jgi:hypothetical protein